MPPKRGRRTAYPTSPEPQFARQGVGDGWGGMSASVFRIVVFRHVALGLGFLELGLDFFPGVTGRAFQLRELHFRVVALGFEDGQLLIHVCFRLALGLGNLLFQLVDLRAEFVAFLFELLAPAVLVVGDLIGEFLEFGL